MSGDEQAKLAFESWKKELENSYRVNEDDYILFVAGYMARDKVGQLAHELIISTLKEIVENPGVRPDYHYSILQKHRQEWPVLWSFLDLLLRNEDR